MWIKKENDKIIEYRQLPPYYKHWGGSFREQPDKVHRKEGFIKVIDPVGFNPETQYKTGRRIEVSENVYEYETKDIVLPDIEEIRSQKLAEFRRDFIEISNTITYCENNAETDEQLQTIAVIKRFARISAKSTIAKIKSITDTLILQEFHFLPEDKQALLDKLEPFM